MEIAERVVIGSAIEEALALLPEGWQLQLELSRGWWGVFLIDPMQRRHPHTVTNEGHTIHDAIRDAAEYAIEHQ